MKDYFLALRELVEHGETVHRGRRKLLGWPKERMSNPPLYLVVEGPRMLRLGGAIADGVYIGAGLLPEVITDAVAAVHEGAREAGRDPAGIDIWWDSRFSVAPTHEEALAAALESIASPGNHALRGGFQGKHIPSDLEPKLVQFHQGYDYAEKGRGGKNTRLMDALGLRDYFLRRFGVIGTPREVVERLRSLESLGVSQISVQMRDMEQLQLFAREVMPELSEPSHTVLAGA
jgi:5,10-methylenetetrahydromethanopterin reductase